LKILLLDIETAPNLAYVWGIWEQNVGLNQLMNADYMLCWSAKWKGDETIYFASREKNSAKIMLKPLHKLLEEADAVVHYNGKRFDIPWINREFILNGLKPPSPYKQIDLMETVKRQFKFPSNKLEYVTKALGVGEKVKHIGFDLWLGCIKNDKESWKLMQEYNIGDIVVLESLYDKILPWIKGHANHSMHSKGELVCPRCGSSHVQKRGYTNTLASTFQRYQCVKCGGWFKDNTRLNSKDFKTSEIV
jgi:DNA polymerase elongation subunit (family B)